MSVNLGEKDYKYTEFLKLLHVNGTGGAQKVGMALFGLGRAGTIHLKNMMENPRVDLLYIVEARKERSTEIQMLLGLPASLFVTPDKTSTVLNDARVKAVVIATPTDEHQQLILDSLKAGKKVFSEKPLASDVEGVKSCYETAEKLGLPLLCAFNRRWDPTCCNVEQRVLKGEIGKVHVIKTTARDSPKPSMDYLKISNGIFHDCAVHDIDLVCWVIKEYPTKVYATAVAHDPAIKAINDHDTVVINLTFPSGALGVIDLSRQAVYGYDQRLEVFGNKGMLTCPGQNVLPVEHYTAEGVSKHPIWFSFPSKYEDAYKGELDHFLNIVEGKEKVAKVQAKETIAVCKIASACEESVRTGKVIEMKY